MHIQLPAGVTVDIEENNAVLVKGPKGELTDTFHPKLQITKEGDFLLVSRPDDEKETRALHGLTRSLLHNMVVGVTEGFSEELQINGVGYRAAKQGSKLVLNLGFSHQIFFEEPENITIEVPQTNKILIKGIDKQKVGQLAADIRAKRPPEPYLGKGVKYANEVIRRKAGKAGK